MSDSTPSTPPSAAPDSQPDALAELRELRRTMAAMKFGLPDALAARLRGETRAEIEADAAELAKLVNPAANPPPDSGSRPVANRTAPTGSLRVPAGIAPGNSASAISGPTTADRIRSRIDGGASPFFDPDFHRAKGGGIREE